MPRGPVDRAVIWDRNKHPGERFGIRPHRMRSREQPAAASARSTGLQRIADTVDRRGEPIIPGQPQQIGKLGHRHEEKAGLRTEILLVAKNTFPAGPGAPAGSRPHTGAVRTRSSSDFKVMPAAKAALRSSGSRPRGKAQHR